MADVKENAMTGGVPARIRALDGNGNSISPSMEEVNLAIPLATLANSGKTDKAQARYSFIVNANSTLILSLPFYGMYLFVNEQISGNSLIFHKSYYISEFKIVLDPLGIHGSTFRLEQLNDGSNDIKFTNLSSTINQKFSINRL